MCPSPCWLIKFGGLGYGLVLGGSRILWRTSNSSSLKRSLKYFWFFKKWSLGSDFDSILEKKNSFEFGFGNQSQFWVTWFETNSWLLVNFWLAPSPTFFFPKQFVFKKIGFIPNFFLVLKLCLGLILIPKINLVLNLVLILEPYSKSNLIWVYTNQNWNWQFRLAKLGDPQH